MKAKAALPLAILALTFFFPFSAKAHLAGQPPFFKINNEYSGLYSVPVSSTLFDIPQDASPKNFKAGEKIDFEIDTKPLQIPEEVVKKSTFVWNFGDGATGSGLKNTHAYSKTGSFLLTVEATYAEVSEPTLLQSVVVHVIDDDSYQLPKAQIKVNGKAAKDPLVDIFHVDFDNEITFEAETESKNVTFLWDLGGGKTSEGKTVTNTYAKNSDRTQYFPILRVTDDKGFFTDSYVQLSFGGTDVKSPATSTAAKGIDPKILVIPVVFIVVVFGYLVTTKKK